MERSQTYALRELVPSEVSLVELSDPGLAEPLHAEEEAVVARAIDRRKIEFALGRTAVRKALRELGVSVGALLPREDRSILWPDEAWGSITHTEGLCLAIAARRSTASGLGIDAERRRRVRRELWRLIATEAETQVLERGANEESKEEQATLLFSAKEAFYKAQFCVTRGWVGFHDVELAIREDGTFVVELGIDVDPFRRGKQFWGRWIVLPEHVVTAMVLPP